MPNYERIMPKLRAHNAQLRAHNAQLRAHNAQLRARMPNYERELKCVAYLKKLDMLGSSPRTPWYLCRGC
jgi:hypothetical protein